jgi:ribosomal protein S27AE
MAQRKGVIVMAQSRCAACGNSTFEIEYKSLSGSRYQLAFVQCSKCGTVVGVTDKNDTAALLAPICKKLEI